MQETLELALVKAGLDHVRVRHRPRLLSDNGPAYLSKKLKTFLEEQAMSHTRGALFHPMTQGMIKRYHRAIKNVVLLRNYFTPWALERAIADFVLYYNTARYHDALDTLRVTPADVYLGRTPEIHTRRQQIKQPTAAL